MLLQRLTSVVVVVMVMVMVVKAEDDSGYDDSPPRYDYDSAGSQSFRDNDDDDFDSDEANYNFNYAVRDDHFSTNFGHQKTREGKNTRGSYYVHLPDGRLQKVTYHVDGDSGFVAEVSYEGEARHVSKESYSPPRSSHRSSRESEELNSHSAVSSHESSTSRESYSPSRTSKRRTRESGEFTESYKPPRASYRSQESKESEESYVSVSFKSPQSVEAPKRTNKDPKAFYETPSPSRVQNPSTPLLQQPVGSKGSRRGSKHTSSEETRIYSPPKPSLISGSFSRRSDSSEERGSQEHHNSRFSASSGSKEKRGRVKGSKDTSYDSQDSYEIPHRSRSSNSSEEKSRRAKDSQDSSSAPKDSYEAPVYIPNYPRPSANSYQPENLLREGYA